MSTTTNSGDGLPKKITQTETIWKGGLPMKKPNFLSVIFVLCLSLLLIMPVYAEEPSGPVASPNGADAQPLDEQTIQQEQENLMQNLPNAFGEFPSFTVSNTDAWSFQPAGDGVLYTSHYGSKLGRSRVAGSDQWKKYFNGPIENIPTGALVFGMQIEACDGNASDRILVDFYECPSPADFGLLRATVETGIAATPGCGFFNAVVDPPVLIWNFGRTYLFTLEDGDLSTSTSFRVARLFWSRGISPAPGTATFNDVGKSHWAFQSVEALAASGITKGCPDGPNLFCPDKPVSRAAMAAFLARALGLHWPG